MLSILRNLNDPNRRKRKNTWDISYQRNEANRKKISKQANCVIPGNRITLATARVNPRVLYQEVSSNSHENARAHGTLWVWGKQNPGIGYSFVTQKKTNRTWNDEQNATNRSALNYSIGMGDRVVLNIFNSSIRRNAARGTKGKMDRKTGEVFLTLIPVMRVINSAAEEEACCCVRCRGGK